MRRAWQLVMAALFGALTAGAAGCGGGGSGSGGSATTGGGGAGAGGATTGGATTGGATTGGATTGGGGGAPCDPASCPTPAECFDAICDANGQCAEAPKADGTPASKQTPGDCKQAICTGGAVTPQSDDGDLPDDGNDCTDDLCTDGVPNHPAKAKDAPCGPGGASFCDGAGACAECNVPSQCAGQDTECQSRSCDAGVCGVTFAPLGTPTMGQTMGDCLANQCDGAGSIESVTDDADVEDDGNPCTDDSCSAGTAVHDPTPIQTVCGVDLKCDGQGNCVGCIDDSDCAAPANPCLAAVCTAGMCTTQGKPDGTACNDGNACTQSDTCQSGACTGASPVICAALDQCHDAGACDPATGACSNPTKTDGTACSDGNACTQTDTCQNGACTGANPVTCAALDQCHLAGTCNPNTGVCSNPNKANGASCSDGNACTQTDTCQNGACTGANPVTCAALDQCHLAGTCNPNTGVCSNPNKANGASCSDGNACTQTDTCQNGACTGANPVTCAALDQCHDAGTCNPNTGVCSNPNKVNGASCSDGNACTQTDTCQNGACTGASPVTCTALDQCHVAGTCNPATGVCSNPNKANGASCSDGNACTQTDTCQNGACTGASPVTCTALDQCHVAGTCNPNTGVCSNPNKPDGSACSQGATPGTCGNGVCSVCGNGVTEGIEGCDDANAIPCDGCSPKCQTDVSITYQTASGLNATITDDAYNGTQASMTCVNITVTAAGDGTVDYVCPSVDMTHSWLGDLTIKLVSPANTVITLASRPGVAEVADDGTAVGGDSSNLLAPFAIRFQDGSATSAESMGSALTNSQVVCRDDGVCLFDPNAGAAAPGKLGAFIGQSAAGTWKLCVGDGGLGDVGSINQVKLIVGQ